MNNTQSASENLPETAVPQSESAGGTAQKKSKYNPAPVSGIIVINKHEGVTSHNIISACRRLYNTRQIGHTGTLDPMATGVLPVLIGRAVKASDYIMANDKVYTAELKLGLTTDTEDITGEVISRSCEIPVEDEVKKVCAAFVGKIMQTPPMYSAIKVGGRKLCDIAREGGEVERKPREVEIYSIESGRIAADTYRLRVHCSKGTYIRTLCADIGRKLNCGGVMSSLVREKSGCYSIDNAVTIAELEAMPYEQRLLLPEPVESLFMDLKSVSLPDYYTKLIRSGADIFQKKVKVSVADGERVRLYSRGEFIALGVGMTVDDTPVIRQEKIFVL